MFDETTSATDSSTNEKEGRDPAGTRPRPEIAGHEGYFKMQFTVLPTFPVAALTE